MTLIEMAKEAGFETKRDMVFVDDIGINKALERFAALVAEKATEQANARQNASWALMCKKMVAAEREECAKVCEAKHSDKRGHDAWGWLSEDYAAAIRARGEGK